MVGVVRLVDREADDLAAVEVEDHVKIDPHSFYVARQERHVPAPDLAGGGRDMGCWPAGRP